MELRPFERWCQGRRSLGYRALRHEEQELLRARRRGLGWRVVGPVAGYVACAYLLSRLQPYLPQADLGAFRLEMSPWLGFVLGLPIAIVLAVDRFREARDLSRDLREARVERFAPVDPTTFTASPAVLELCVPSGRVYTGPPDQLGRVAKIREIAPAPFVHARVEQWDHDLPPGIRLERRELSEEEREELRRAAKRLGQVRVSSVLLLLWLAVCLFGWLEPARAFSDQELIALGVTLLVALFLVGRALRDRAVARRMRADAAAGFALVFSAPDSTEPEEEALPHSRLFWSAAGLPAEWRGRTASARGRG
jgi:hypothetical protein